MTTKFDILIRLGVENMRLSDVIEDFIKDLIRETDGTIEIQRNELAEYFNCVPSQINYVIATRFNANQGYYVESRRGGGGNIKIKKINITKSNYLMHIIASMGETISMKEVEVFINNFLLNNIITEKEARIMRVVTSDNVLNVPISIRDNLRANIFKNVLVNLIEE